MPRAPERSALGRLAIAAAVLLLGGAAPHLALAQAALSSAGHDTLEQRIAIALGPSRTVVWTQVHATAEAGAFALIVPVEAGAGLDLSTEAWLEALEATTAPRILPPSGVDALCPGDAGPPPVHVAGDLEHHASLVPAEVDTLVGAADVLLWAAERELDVPSSVAQAFAQSEATHFVAMRFAAPSGDVWSPTLRVAFPGVATSLPLALGQAGSVELRTTLFVLGEGRAGLPGDAVTVDGGSLAIDGAARTSDYFAARSAALSPAGSWLVESASHTSLVAPFSPGLGEPAPALASEYFLRASEYGAATSDPSACASASVAAIATEGTFAEACPREDLGVVDGGPACVEDPQPGEVGVAALRCGGDADDLAVGLSGLSGPEVWLTRIALRSAPGQVGVDATVLADPGAAVEPVLEAGGVDLSGCGEGGGNTTSGAGGQSGAGPSGGGPGPSAVVGAGPGAGAGPIAYVEVPVQVYDVTCGCDGTWVIVDSVSVPEDQAPEGGSYYVEDGDDCGGETSDTYAAEDVESSPTGEDDCGGDTSGSAESDDGCGSDTSDSASDDGGCSGDTTDTSSGDDGGSSDGDDGGSDDGGDDGGSDDGGSGDDSGCDCGDEKVAAAAMRAPARTRAGLRSRPKLSVMALGLAFVLAPLRRWSRPRRRQPRP